MVYYAIFTARVLQAFLKSIILQFLIEKVQKKRTIFRNQQCWQILSAIFEKAVSATFEMINFPWRMFC